MTEPEGNSIVGVDPSSGSVVLTYDDGPTPGVTDQLLTVLAGAGASATFFVLLSRVRPHLELFREVLAAGHEIGLHGPDHRRLTTLPPELRSSLPHLLRDAKAELEDLASVPVRWFRPPYGAQDAGTWRAARESDLTPVLWTLECQDWLTLPLEDQLASVHTGPLAGSIVLMHDGYADAADGVDDGPPPVLDRPALTAAVLTEVHAAGLRPRSLGEALASSQPTWRPWFDEG